MHRTRAPLRVWDDCLGREALVRSAIALDIYSLRDETQDTMVKGETGDISKLAEFVWYDLTL
jgi:hypothetical protein